MSRALIVDDHAENRYYLQTLLGASGFKVDSANNGAEALALARLAPPDLIIADLLMPVMDGYTLLRHWKQDNRLKLIPFIVYTATYTGAEDQQLAMQLGADAFILKPAEPDELLSRVVEVRARITPELPATRVPIGDDQQLMTLYSETLVRKLEEKTLQLEQANHALQQELRDRNDIEQALRVSEQRLVAAQEVGKIGSWESDLDLQVLHWSEQTHRIFETQPLQFVPTQQEFLQRVHPDDREQVRLAFASSLQHAAPCQLEHRLLFPDGRIKYIEERWQVFQDAAGNPVRTLGTSRDISEHKLAQQEIIRSSELLLAVVEGIPDSVYVKDREGRYLLFNQGACNAVGQSVEAVLGKDDAALFGPEIARVLREVDLEVMRSGQARVSEEVIPSPDIGRTFLTCKAPYRDGTGAIIGIIGVSRDISDRRRMEVALQQTLADLDTRNRVLRDFAFVTSQDLRKPLADLRALSDLVVAQRQELPEHTQDPLARMNQICASMQILVDDVLTHSRVSGGRCPLREVDLTSICHEVLDELDSMVRSSGAQVRVSALPFIRADPIQMRQLFRNLLSNALKFHAPGRPPQIRVTCAATMLGDAQGIRLEFIDNGIGFDPAVAERIFDPFQRVHIRSDLDSTGVGLTIASRIVDRHRGTMEAHGTPGEGARFTICLPRTGGLDIHADSGAD